MEDFLCLGLLADCLLIRLHGVIVWEYEAIFNTKYFIIIGKITLMLSQTFNGINIRIHTNTRTQVAVYWRCEMADTHTYIHFYPTPDLACTNTFTPRGAPVVSIVAFHVKAFDVKEYLKKTF